MSKGVDIGVRISLAEAHQIKAAGFDFVCRYYSHTPAKNLSLAECQAFRASGLWTVAVWETAGDRPEHFTRAQGYLDGCDAHDFAAGNIGQPDRTPIYFAVDFDANSSQIAGGIKDYFEGIAQAFAFLKSPYEVGVYGSGLVCGALLDEKLASFAWLAMAGGWAGSHSFSRWNLRQEATMKISGMEFDTNESQGNGGGFQI